MHSDTLLQAFLQEPDETAATCLLQRLLIEFAEPVILAIIESRFHVSLRHTGSRVQSLAEQDAEDMRGKVLLDLTARLRDLQNTPDRNPVRDFRAYAAMTTY